MIRLVSPFLACALVLGCARAGDLEFFEEKVRPLLIERCYECHAEGKKIKGGLRLDLKEGWTVGGDTGPAIVPGNLDDSLVIEAVRYANRDLEMPPKQKLPPEEIAILEEWVRRGAPDPRTESAARKVSKNADVWSFKPVAPVEPPAVGDATTAPIDRFLLARLQEKGLRFSPPADRSTLLRRLSYALIGLPPSPEELLTFERHEAPDAFEKEVDRLLASPAFGEQWGRHWLDVARFAESSGGGRTLPFKDAWRYRDYVLESFNRGVPYDQFVREQIAGDLLPHRDTTARSRQLTATGFLALGPTNYEEQDKQALRMDIVDEQMDTMGKAFMAVTIGCARCHDHKFDPISQRDYYAMAGIFRSTKTLRNYTDNVAHWVDADLPMEPELQARVAAHDAQVAELKTRVDQAKAHAAKYTARNATPSLTPGRPVAPADLPGVIVDDMAVKRVGEWKFSKFSRSYIGKGSFHDLADGKGTKTLTFMPELPASGRYEVRLSYVTGPDRATMVPVTVLHADGEELVRVDESNTPAIEGRFVSLGQYRFEKGGAGFVLVSNEGTKGYVSADAVQFLPVEEATSDAAPQEDPAAAEALKSTRALERELKKLIAAAPPRPQVMSVAEGEIADAALAIRGNIRNLGEVVPRGFIQAAQWSAPPGFSTEASGRLELANWVADARNPLTSRVMANRIWHWLFGVGLVRTTDNFGVMGELPSNPELLDYIAHRFSSEGWSVKRLIREIVLTRAWQQSSAHSAEGAAIDPENRLLWRMPRRRLDAEELRDTILTVSQQLQREYGGPGILGADGAPVDANTTASQNLEYGYQFPDVRRSVYTPGFRNNRLELLATFDMADPNSVTGRRNVSTVAPQALYLLNHPFPIEQARHAAQATAGVGDSERIEQAFLRALSRLPSEEERRAALDFVSTPPDGSPEKAWAQFYQMLFACVDFRYVY